MGFLPNPFQISSLHITRVGLQIVKINKNEDPEFVLLIIPRQNICICAFNLIFLKAQWSPFTFLKNSGQQFSLNWTKFTNIAYWFNRMLFLYIEFLLALNLHDNKNMIINWECSLHNLLLKVKKWLSTKVKRTLWPVWWDLSMPAVWKQKSRVNFNLKSSEKDMGARWVPHGRRLRRCSVFFLQMF